MDNTGYLLADSPGFGRIFDCGACGFLHLTVGPVSLTLTPDAYMQLVALLNTSAANFELWMHANGKGISAIPHHESDCGGQPDNHC